MVASHERTWITQAILLGMTNKTGVTITITRVESLHCKFEFAREATARHLFPVTRFDAILHGILDPVHNYISSK